jgi:Flp pilus assembly pilin Flp
VIAGGVNATASNTGNKYGGAMSNQTRDKFTRLGRVRRQGQRDERGATILEFAFVMVISLVLIFAIIDFARALYSFHFISEAAREATRFAAVRGGDCNPVAVSPCPAGLPEIQAYVDQLVPAGIDGSQITTTPNFPGGSGTLPMCGGSAIPGCPVKVDIQYQFNFIFPASFYNLPPISYLPSSITMHSESVMNVSR